MNLILLLACGSDNTVRRDPEDPVTLPDPPDDIFDEWGQPPDWADCFEGFRGMYFNLENGHPDVEPDFTVAAPTDHSQLDWWDQKRMYSDQFDPTIDYGTNWWPVDDGLADDPSYFTARWMAWIRVWSDGEVRFSLGAATDAWVVMDDDQVLATINGSEDYDPQEFSVGLDTTQAHFDVRYAHRAGDTNGFRFRVLSGDVSICYPDYSAEQQ